jgi:hypothetical protein
MVLHTRGYSPLKADISVELGGVFRRVVWMTKLRSGRLFLYAVLVKVE